MEGVVVGSGGWGGHGVRGLVCGRVGGGWGVVGEVEGGWVGEEVSRWVEEVGGGVSRWEGFERCGKRWEGLRGVERRKKGKGEAVDGLSRRWKVLRGGVAFCVLIIASSRYGRNVSVSRVEGV